MNNGNCLHLFMYVEITMSENKTSQVIEINKNQTVYLILIEINFFTEPHLVIYLHNFC